MSNEVSNDLYWVNAHAVWPTSEEGVLIDDHFVSPVGQDLTIDSTDCHVVDLADHVPMSDPRYPITRSW